jgi:Flp pilus assembly protein TadG
VTIRRGVVRTRAYKRSETCRAYAGVISKCRDLLWGSGTGSQLLEFALALPFLLVVVIGIIDFGGAYNLKQTLTNAAREGARIAVSNPLTNATCSDPQPCSIEAAADAVSQYLTNAGLPASCISPNSPSSSGTLTWTYSCNGITLTINRGFVFTSTGGQVVSGTQVTLTYPVTWTFNRIIGLLVRGASASLPATLTTSVVMQNLV